MKCDIKIMAVPTRMANVVALCGQLGLTINDVFCDYKMQRKPLYTSRGAFMLPYADGITHRLVLQDDVMICDNLQEFCDMLVNRYPNDIITLFYNQHRKLKITDAPPCVRRVRSMTGQGIIIPRKYIADIFSFLDKHNPDYPHDDAYYNLYCKLHKLRILCPIPNVINTREDINSEMDNYGIYAPISIRADIETNPLNIHWEDKTKEPAIGVCPITMEMIMNNENR